MSTFRALLDQEVHWRVRYRKHRTIYHEGDEASGIYALVRGCVCLQVDGIDGHRQILSFLFPGDVFGMSVSQRTCSAEAVSDVEVVRYPLESVLRLSTQSKEFAAELLRVANAQFRDLAHHVATVTRMPAPDRVMSFFFWLAHRQGRLRKGVPLPMTRRAIGDYLALSPETLSRVLGSLRAQGILSFCGPRSFSLLQPVEGGLAELDQVSRDLDRIRGPEDLLLAALCK